MATKQYKDYLIQTIMTLSLMSGGAISVNQLWDSPVHYRKKYQKIIIQWFKESQKRLFCPFGK